MLTFLTRPRPTKVISPRKHKNVKHNNEQKAVATQKKCINNKQLAFAKLVSYVQRVVCVLDMYERKKRADESESCDEY